MDQNIKVKLKIINEMEKELILGKIKQYTQDNGQLIK